MLGKLRLRQFCYCCTLRTGGYIIAICGWLGTIAYNTSYQRGYSGESLSISVVALCMLGVSTALLYGIYSSDRKYMIPWLGIKLFECCILTILAIILFFDLFVEYEVTDAFLAFLLFGGIAAIFWYFFLCVWSLYMDMGETTETIIPVGDVVPIGEPMPGAETILMTEQIKHSPTEIIKSPPQEMV